MKSVLGSKSASGTPFYASLILSLLWIIFYSSVNRCKVTMKALVHLLYQVLFAQVCHQLAKLLKRNARLKFLDGLVFCQRCQPKYKQTFCRYLPPTGLCSSRAWYTTYFCLQATRKTYFIFGIGNPNQKITSLNGLLWVCPTDIRLILLQKV